VRPDAVVDHEDDRTVVIRHDARDLPLDDATVDLIVTSPPYFALRSYRDDGDHYGGQIGSEDTPEAFLEALDGCMVEWWRVLKPSGSVWVNLGDKYAGTGGANSNTGLGFADVSDATTDNRGSARNNTKQTRGYRAKSLLGLPWRMAIRQIDAGWILRAEVVWSKPNGLPESVTDRVRRSHEQWFHFVKEPRYFSAVDEIREPHKYPLTAEEMASRMKGNKNSVIHGGNRGVARGDRPNTEADLVDATPSNPLGRLPSSVWTIPTEPLIVPDAVRETHDLPDHFAAFPQEWPRKLILGWSPSGVCVECGAGRRPVVDKVTTGRDNSALSRTHRVSGHIDPEFSRIKSDHPDRIIGYACACNETTAATTPALVLDPFGGTGTVAGVARTLGRYGISNDLSADYNRLAIWRIWESGHFAKTEQRTWADRQTRLA